MTASPAAIPARTYGWRTAGEPLREMALGALVGIVILIIENSRVGEMPGLDDLARNAIMGAVIIAGSRGLETMVSWAIEQSRVAMLFRTIVYIVGAWIGYFASVMIVTALFGRQEKDLDARSFHFFYALGITAAVSVLVGLVLHHNRKRNDRLRASIERLKEHEFAEKELEIARAMQRRLLPPQDIERDGYRVTARTEAAHIVGGDFYDVIRLSDGAIAVLAADVAGKGIAASLVMASCKAAVPFLAASGGAADVMNALNQTLATQLERREFVAMVFCRYDTWSGEAEIVNAGMPDPFLLTARGEVNAVLTTGERLPLGAMRAARYGTTRITLQPGDRLLMFSDGLPEAIAGGSPIGYERAEALVRASASVDDLPARLMQIEGLRIDDDLTLVMLERTSKIGPTDNNAAGM